jgi:RHS repeat-associated protein
MTPTTCPPALGDDTSDMFQLVDSLASETAENNDMQLLSTVESLGARGERRLMAGADTDHAIAWPRRGASDVRRQWHQILGMTNKVGAHELDHIDDVDTLYRRTKATREPRRLAGAKTDRAQARPRRGEGAERRRLNQNRLISMQSAGSQIVVGTITQNIPSLYITFSYDGRSRRIGKVVRTAAHNASPYSPSPMSWPVTLDERYIYDGWSRSAWRALRQSADRRPAGRVAREAGSSSTFLVPRLKDGNPTLAGFQPALVQTYVWGPDLSGTMDEAGGVGGLLQIKDWEVNKTWAPCYDGNGNILSLIRLDQTTPNSLTICEGRYEYDPFGNLLRVTGEAAERTPFRFSTKYTDHETGLVYYGYRYYKPDWGKWINRDPIGERGGVNVYGMVKNDLVILIDKLGREILGDNGLPLDPTIGGPHNGGEPGGDYPDGTGPTDYDLPPGVTPEIARGLRGLPEPQPVPYGATSCDWSTILQEVMENFCGFGNKPTGDDSCSIAHCIASCRIAKCDGTAVAEVLGIGKEYWQMINGQGFDLGDIVANGHGNEIAEKKGHCEGDCFRMAAEKPYLLER